MWVHVLRASAATTLWLLSLVTMIGRTFGGPSYLAGWAILMALGACVFTVWHLLVVERMRAETIARLAAEVALEERQRRESQLEVVK